MEDIIRSRLNKNLPRADNVHRVREFLQLLILKIIHGVDYFQFVSFVGGTSLRILFGLQRFSEDLDFSVTQKDGYDFNRLLKGIELHLQKAGFHVEIKAKTQKTVQSAYFRFVGLLQHLDVARTKDEKLSIRVEIDSNPPEGWNNEMSVINDFFVFPVWHFDLPSLFATKIHACFFRKYRKGRDFYDLMWYLSKRVTPNFILLNNAIQQTEGLVSEIGAGNIEEFLKARMQDLDFSSLRKDVTPFLANRSEADLISYDVFSGLIDKL